MTSLDKPKVGVFSAVLGLLFGGMVAAVLVALGLFTNGVALMYVWNWFIPHIFPGLPTLNLYNSMGIGLIVGYLTYQFVNIEKEYVLKALATSIILQPLIVLAVGYFLHLHQ